MTEYGTAREVQNDGFWQAFDKVIAESEIIIDRPKGSRHPQYPDSIAPLDYGYLNNTTSPDGEGIDLWRGSDSRGLLDAVICTVDPVKRDCEIKLLIGCTEDEKALVFPGKFMKGILIRRT